MATKRGRKPKEKKGYFEEREEQAVAEYNRYGKIISGATIDELKLRLNCEEDDIVKMIDSGRTLYDILELAKDIPIEDMDVRRKISELDKIISISREEREKIYNTILTPAFKKMVESIIRSYKLYVPDENFDTTFNDTLSYLITKLDNFKKPKGTKAYSYCGTICKNYLLFKKIQYDKGLRRYVPYEMIRDGLSDSITYSDAKEERNTSNKSEKLMKAIAEEIQKMINNKDDNKLTDSEVVVGSAIIELLNNWESIIKSTEDDTNKDDLSSVNQLTPYKSISNKLQKSKILYFLREETMMSTKEVRDNMKKYKNAYLAIKKMMQES